MAPSMKGKVVVITGNVSSKGRDTLTCLLGASSGIGAEIALEYAKLGATLVLAARRMHDLKEVAEGCLGVGASGNCIMVLATDVSRKEDCAVLIQQTLERFGSIDLLVNSLNCSVRCSPSG